MAAGTRKRARRRTAPPARRGLGALLARAGREIVFEFDAQARYLEVWADDDALITRPAEEMLGRTINEVLGVERGQYFTDLVERVCATGRAETLAYTLEVRGMPRRFLAQAVRAPADPARPGQPPTVVFHARDITEYHRAQEQVARYQVLLERASDLVVVASVERGAIIDANAAAVRAYDCPRDELLGRPLLDLWGPGPERDAAAARLHGEGARAGVVFETVHVRRDGACLPVEVSAQRTAGEDGPVLVCIIHDISERRRAEAALRAQNDRLAALSRRLLEVQEQERRHLARELHDEVGQVLTGLKFTLESTVSRLPADDVAAADRVRQAQEMVDQLIRYTRVLSLDLRPATLDELGLMPALLAHLERCRTQTGVRVRLMHAGIADRRFAPAVETAAYRIVQEALTNVARHAGVSEASLRIHATDAATLRIEVRDAGRGFDPERALRGGCSSGLVGMRERATLLGGQLAVESAPGAGCTLVADLPLRQPSCEALEVAPLPAAAAISSPVGAPPPDDAAARGAAKLSPPRARRPRGSTARRA